MGSRRFVLHDMREALHDTAVDVVFLQELQGQHLLHQKNIQSYPAQSQLEFLADTLWPYTAYGKNAVYQHGHHGNAIISRYPLVEWENINVSPRSYASRSLLHAVIEPDAGMRIHLICVHLGLFERERRQQMQLLAERINSHVPIDEALIVAGDFNDWRSQGDAYIKGRLRIQEVFEQMTGGHARTFPAAYPVLKVDRIYYRGFDGIEECQRLDSPQWRTLSDHLPLYAHMRIG